MLDDTDETTTSTGQDAAPPSEGAPDQGPDTGPGDVSGAAPAKRAAAKKAPAKKAAAKKAPAKKAPAKKAPAKKAATKKTAAAQAGDVPLDLDGADAGATAVDADSPAADAPAKKAAAKKAPAKKAAAKKAPAKRTSSKKTAEAPAEPAEVPGDAAESGDIAPVAAADDPDQAATAPPALTFQPPDPAKATPARRTRKTAATRAAEAEPADATDASEGDAATAGPGTDSAPGTGTRSGGRSRGGAGTRAAQQGQDGGERPDEERPDEDDEDTEDTEDDSADGTGAGGGNRRRRRRGGRRRRRSGGGGGGGEDSSDTEDSSDEAGDSSPQRSAQGGGETRGNDNGNDNDNDNENDGDGDGSGEGSASSRRRRRRRRTGEDGDNGQDDPENTVTRVRKQRSPEDEITALSGSTRLEAKKQRRREGREAGRRRAPIVSEAEFLARREAVDRVMVIRQRKDLTQIAVLEDKVLVEHYVAREAQTSLIGNVYLGRVQNVLPSMEAAFIDIGKGRNAVLYAGEVNWDSLGAGNGPRKIEQVLKSGQSVLVQVTKDPVGHKGARLTSQVSLPGRFLVYVPDGTTSGISRKLPDTERNRLKSLLKEIVPDTAGVIVRTAAEGASEEELTRDVERLTARWEEISGKVAKGNAPQLLYGEPDLTLKVVRDLFTEDFGKLVVSGDSAWDMVEDYVEHIAPDLSERLERYDGGNDVFAAYRIDEQIAKALDRKVWLPSGGSLIIDRTEAMTVVDVNTGKFTGSGGNLEETVTKNNLEAAEEIVRQLRLRDIGGIIVVDFIDMVLESNRDLVLRRMVECLGRDRTRHQVAEVTSLGLVQMTRKRIGTGLLEAFSESCEPCNGRGLLVHHEPVDSRRSADDESRRGRRTRGRGKGEDAGSQGGAATTPSPKDVAAMAKPPVEKPAEEKPADEKPAERIEDRPAETEPVEQRPAAKRSVEDEPTRNRSEVDRAPEQPAEDKPADEQPAEDKPADEQPEPADGQAAEQVPATAPAAPRVVTTTRRRSARRPAGQPSAASAGSDGEAAPAQPAQPQPVQAPPTQPEVNAAPPRVVATSRRGVARRPSAPPAAAPEQDGAEPSAPSPDGPEVDQSPDPAPEQDGAEPSAPSPDGPGGDQSPDSAEDGAAERRIAVHVPVKNKGARKH